MELAVDVDDDDEVCILSAIKLLTIAPSSTAFAAETTDEICFAILSRTFGSDGVAFA